MKSIMKYSAILLLLSVALVLISSSSVTAVSVNTNTYTPLMYNNTTLTITPFYIPTFGVHIFQGADPVGAYSVNINPDYVYYPYEFSV